MLIWLNLILAFIVFYGGSIVWKELSEPIVPAMAQYKQYQQKIEPMPSEVLDTINYYAKLFGVSPELAIKITTCESKNNPTIIGNEKVALNSYGLWQWQPQSFYQYAAKYKIKNANLYDYRDQTLVAMMVLRDGGKDIWSCGKNLK
jgi:hypothetical protein